MGNKICVFCGGENNTPKSPYCTFNCYQKFRYHNTSNGKKIRERVRINLRKRRKSLKFRKMEAIRKKQYYKDPEVKKRFNEYMKNYMRDKKLKRRRTK